MTLASEGGIAGIDRITVLKAESPTGCRPPLHAARTEPSTTDHDFQIEVEGTPMQRPPGVSNRRRTMCIHVAGAADRRLPRFLEQFAGDCQ